MALFDVSKVITVFQRLCHFAEEFTDEYREPLGESLLQLFQEDLEEGEEAPNVDTMVRSLVRRLRRTFESLVDSEAELIVAIKDNTESSSLRQQLTQNLRAAFERARSECRTHYGRAMADVAGFPNRIAVNSSAVERQTKVVRLKMRKPDFELGEPVVKNSTATTESILAMFEPEVEDLRTGMSKAVRRRARIHGRQVAKDSQLSDFRATYSLFVNMVRSAFRLAGQGELAKRMTLTQPSRRTTTEPGEGTSDAGTPGDGTPDDGTLDDGTPDDGTPDDGAPVDPGQTDVAR